VGRPLGTTAASRSSQVPDRNGSTTCIWQAALASLCSTATGGRIQEERAILASAAPAPLFAQQQTVLKTLVNEWGGMTADERKRILAAIFDSITASAEGVKRLEPCGSWRPYVVAAIPQPVEVR